LLTFFFFSFFSSPQSLLTFFFFSSVLAHIHFFLIFFSSVFAHIHFFLIFFSSVCFHSPLGCEGYPGFFSHFFFLLSLCSHSFFSHFFLLLSLCSHVIKQWVTTQCELFLLLSLIFFLQPLLVLAAHYFPLLQAMHGG
jgi:hypothetical protein